MTCEEMRPLLSAYHDGELDAVQRAELDEHLPDCEACRTELARYRRLGQAIRRDAPSFSAPASLRASVEGLGAPKPAFRFGTFGLGLACGLLFAALFISMRPTSPGTSFAAMMVDDHVRSLMANHLIDVPSSDRHTVKPWFLGKVDFAPTVLDLASEGFPLKGGRLDYLGGRPAAVLVYGRGKHVINVFVRESQDEKEDPPAELRGYHLLRFRLDDLSYWAITDASLDDLRAFEKAFQTKAS